MFAFLFFDPGCPSSASCARTSNITARSKLASDPYQKPSRNPLPFCLFPQNSMIQWTSKLTDKTVFDMPKYASSIPKCGSAQRIYSSISGQREIRFCFLGNVESQQFQTRILYLDVSLLSAWRFWEASLWSGWKSSFRNVWIIVPDLQRYQLWWRGFEKQSNHLWSENCPNVLFLCQWKNEK